jgi:hypothetical protein
MEAYKERNTTAHVHLSSFLKQLSQNLKSEDMLEPLSNAWQLNKIDYGFVMSRQQFIKLSEIMQERASHSSGLWTVFFYPKSGHLMIREGRTSKIVFPLVALSENFEYYKWIHGPRLAHEWVKFATELSSLDYDFVLFSKQNDTEMLQSFSTQTDQVHKNNVFVDGGRPYYEPVATEYMGSPYDTIISV